MLSRSIVRNFAQSSKILQRGYAISVFGSKKYEILEYIYCIFGLVNSILFFSRQFHNILFVLQYLLAVSLSNLMSVYLF